MGDRLPERIVSLQNERIKAVRALEMRKARKDSGLFVAEGASILMTARARGFVPETLIFRSGAADDGVAHDLVVWALDAGADVLEVSAAILEKLAAKENPQTLMAVFRQRWAEVPVAAAVAANETWLALETIRDPGNLGTILRTAEAVGVAGVVLAGACCDAFSRECVRATMGSIFSVPVVRMPGEDLAGFIAAWPGCSVATHLQAEQDFRGARYDNPVLLVMGSEGPGLSAAAADACKMRVKIPMVGTLDSFNLAVATALTLYQIQGERLSLRAKDHR